MGKEHEWENCEFAVRANPQGDKRSCYRRGTVPVKRQHTGEPAMLCAQHARKARSAPWHGFVFPVLEDDAVRS